MSDLQALAVWIHTHLNNRDESRTKVLECGCTFDPAYLIVRLKDGSRYRIEIKKESDD